VITSWIKRSPSYRKLYFKHPYNINWLDNFQISTDIGIHSYSKYNINLILQGLSPDCLAKELDGLSPLIEPRSRVKDANCNIKTLKGLIFQ